MGTLVWSSFNRTDYNTVKSWTSLCFLFSCRILWFIISVTTYLYTVWCSGNESTCQSRRCRWHGFDPWVGKIPWSRKWQPMPLFLPGKFHGQRRLAGCSLWCCKELDITECTHTHTCTRTHPHTCTRPHAHTHARARARTHTHTHIPPSRVYVNLNLPIHPTPPSLVWSFLMFQIFHHIFNAAYCFIMTSWIPEVTVIWVSDPEIDKCPPLISCPADPPFKRLIAVLQKSFNIDRKIKALFVIQVNGETTSDIYWGFATLILISLSIFLTVQIEKGDSHMIRFQA